MMDILEQLLRSQQYMDAPNIGPFKFPGNEDKSAFQDLAESPRFGRQEWVNKLPRPLLELLLRQDLDKVLNGARFGLESQRAQSLFNQNQRLAPEGSWDIRPAFSYNYGARRM